MGDGIDFFEILRLSVALWGIFLVATKPMSWVVFYTTKTWAFGDLLSRKSQIPPFCVGFGGSR